VPTWARSGLALLAGDHERAQAAAQRLAELFPGRFYIELQRAGLATNEAHVLAAVQLAARCGLPVVATHPVQFLEADDYDAHEARVCIADGETLANPRRVKRFTREQHFKTQAQMAGAVRRHALALANTLEIARRCNLSWCWASRSCPTSPRRWCDGRVSACRWRPTSASQPRGAGKTAGGCCSRTWPNANRSGRATSSGWSSSWPPS
jgi:DNA polymerase-3 subunit alpha